MGLIDKIKSQIVTKPSEKERISTGTGETTRLAIPSTWPGGIESVRSGHFGRCDCFTLVDIELGKVTDVKVVPNPPHTQGHCLAPVDLLKLHGANAIIVNGIGMRPLTGFRDAGMEVYLGTGDNVSDVILEFIVEALTPVSPQQACGGH